jgi:hypothetical protein
LIQQPFGKFILKLKAGIAIQDQRYRSFLSLQNSPNIGGIPVDTGTNDLTWRTSTNFIESNLEYIGKKLSFSAKLPLIVQKIKYGDVNHFQEKEVNTFFSLPQTSIKYKISSRDNLNISYRLLKDFGQIDDVYGGLVLKNYRYLSSSTGFLATRESHNSNFIYNYVRPERFFFFQYSLKI